MSVESPLISGLSLLNYIRMCLSPHPKFPNRVTQVDTIIHESLLTTRLVPSTSRSH